MERNREKILPKQQEKLCAKLIAKELECECRRASAAALPPSQKVAAARILPFFCTGVKYI
jgi:hypothetical protein